MTGQADANPMPVSKSATRTVPLPPSVEDFLKLPAPPRTPILGDWLTVGSLTLISSESGVGKSMLGLAIAHSIASGRNFIGWQCDHARRVLYVEGELPRNMVQDRITALNGTYGAPPPDMWRVADLEGYHPMPNLSTIEGRQIIDDWIEEFKPDVIFIDSLATLILLEGLDPNTEESWLPIQKWALEHRKAGRSVVFFHHTNKAGAQSGTKSKDRVMDTVIQLIQLGSKSAGKVTRIKWKPVKFRSAPFSPEFEVQYKTDTKNNAIWTRAMSFESIRAQSIELKSRGHSIRQIMEILGVRKNQVEKALKA
ncbi:MAG: AAA family ATPase [Rhodospirillaceae bacterium]